MKIYDVIIIGSGLAALTAAKRLSSTKNVIIFTKSGSKDSNSYQAQGGVAAAIAGEDHWEQHFTDTMKAGAYHNIPNHLEQLTKQGAGMIAELMEAGMEFDREKGGNLDLAQEGGHLRRRILHAGGDATGKGLISFMLERLKDRVSIIENEVGADLIMENGRCIGVWTKRKNGEIRQYFAPTTIIATGGCGWVYTYTSNDPTITGDGIAMAYRAGAELTDMEFVQFHPTLLYKGGKTIGLVSEALRGEGAFLQNRIGQRIMEGVHELTDLAPRDIVARTVFKEIQKGREVFLNISHVKNFSRRFPTIHWLCTRHGLHRDGHLLPVTPGAHFLIGGIKANDYGETSVKGLYAVGEAACTGVHGANRIASNSLLEALVFGNQTAERILEDGTQHSFSICTRSDGPSISNILPDKQEIRDKMSEKVGVVRNHQDLRDMKDWLEQFEFLHVNQLSLSEEQMEVRNMLTVSWLITTSAIKREESLGSHFRSDFPFTLKKQGRKEFIRHISEKTMAAI
ncbi:L-aspartate oxidase [Virgibacillus sediminis]|uniref:L-aspartate oxidase n=1 Tax=Virgibacillus sediminis TaxID=202260 RepID=A0ABV7A1R1_9BACI